ncbi:MAG: AlkZ family DNA glycosylase [Actinobacteria bacterium]|nr:AlkZ family DNA glycosylase [Actinomycetota bacterium]
MAPRTLDNRQLNRALLARQQLLKRKRLPVAKTLHNVGGLQTQEPRDAFIALWSRIDGFDPAKLRAAAGSGKIVRGSYLRCTVHTVTADDFAGFRLPLAEVIARDTSNWRHVYEHIDIAVVAKAVRKLLSDDEPRSAREIAAALQPQFPKAPPEGLAHCARIHVPLVMAPTGDRWGYSRPPRYLLAERWLGRKLLSTTSKGELLLRGIAATGPCSTADLRTWSGLTGVKETLIAIAPELMVFRDERGRELYDLPEAPRPRADTPAPVRFLGEFDNAVLSHDDRARIVDPDRAKRFNVSKNGRRLYTFLVDGFVAGAWKVDRKSKRAPATLEMTPFDRFSRSTEADLQTEAQKLIQMLEPDATEYRIVIEPPVS